MAEIGFRISCEVTSTRSSARKSKDEGKKRRRGDCTLLTLLLFSVSLSRLRLLCRLPSVQFSLVAQVEDVLFSLGLQGVVGDGADPSGEKQGQRFTAKRSRSVVLTLWHSDGSGCWAQLDRRIVSNVLARKEREKADLGTGKRLRSSTCAIVEAQLLQEAADRGERTGIESRVASVSSDTPSMCSCIARRRPRE